MAKEQLKTNKGAIVHEINGVKYFKLQSKYAGDYTKNCGLLGNEIDENFYFLRSYDIESVTVDEDRNLILTRVDGDVISVNIAEELGQPSFEFDKKNGRIIVTFPDGTVEVMDGFLVEGKDIRVATDSTISGDGTILNPLSISVVERTGTYAPASFFVDITSGGTMPDGNKYGKGFRVVTKETIDEFGLLYMYNDVMDIQAALKETRSPWRVPSRKDWADLLNAAEYCDVDRNHDTKCINEWTGKHAGARAKSTNLWTKSYREESGYPVGGEDNLPATGSMGTFRVLPVGLGEGSRGPLSRDGKKDGKNNDVEGFHRLASYWTRTELPVNEVYRGKNENGCANVYTRTFVCDSRKVLQESSKPSSRLSLRLVKDFDMNQMEVSEYENILGYNMPTVLISNPDTEYAKVWTSVNVGFKEFHGIDSDEWSGATGRNKYIRDVYFVNEWTGKKWVKKQMNPGDSVVILDYDNDPATSGDTYIEWRVYEFEDGHQELLDTSAALKKEFEKELEEIKEEINELSAGTIAEIERLDEEIADLSAVTESIIEDVQELSAVTESIIEDVQELSAITEEIIEDVQELSAVTEELAEAVVELSAKTEEMQEEILELSAKTEELEDEILELSAGTIDTIEQMAGVIGLDGDVASGFSVDFKELQWFECDKEDIDRTRPVADDHAASTDEEDVDTVLAKYSPKEYDYCVIHVDETEDFLYYASNPSFKYISDSETLVDAIKALDNALEGEVDRLDEKIDDLSAATEAEVARLDERIDAVQDELDATQAGAGLNEDGSYTNTEDEDHEYISGAENMHEALDKLAENAQKKDINADAEYAFTVDPATAEATNNLELNDGTKIPFTFDFNFGVRDIEES